METPPPPLLTPMPSDDPRSQRARTPSLNSARSPAWQHPLPMTPLQMAGFDPVPPEYQEQNFRTAPTHIVSHQVKGVNVFSGKGGAKVEDWVRDMKYVLSSKGHMSQQAQFNEVVRHTGGRARDLILNLELYQGELSADRAFRELIEEYGDDDVTSSPMSAFYARTQHTNESPAEYAVALEAKLRIARERGEQAAMVDDDTRDRMLATQFMHGLRSQEVRARLAPMRPREMAYRELRKELRVIEAEEKCALAQSFRQNVKPTETPNTSKEIELLTKAMSELAATQQQQMELFQESVRDQQRRLSSLERRMRGKSEGRERGRHPQPQGCYTCGQPGHFARSCPNANPSN